MIFKNKKKMEKRNLSLIVPDSAVKLTTYWDFNHIMDGAAEKAGFEFDDTKKHPFYIPARGKVEYNTLDVNGPELIIRAWDYKYNCPVIDDFHSEKGFARFYAPNANIWRVNPSRESVCEVEDKNLRKYICSFYDTLKTWPDRKRKSFERDVEELENRKQKNNGLSQEDEKSLKNRKKDMALWSGVTQDFEEFFSQY